MIYREWWFHSGSLLVDRWRWGSIDVSWRGR